MERRVILFIVLSITIFILWQHFVIAPRLKEQQEAQERLAQQKSLEIEEESTQKEIKEPISTSITEKEDYEVSELELLPFDQNIEERIIDVDHAC